MKSERNDDAARRLEHAETIRLERAELPVPESAASSVDAPVGARETPVDGAFRQPTRAPTNVPERYRIERLLGRGGFGEVYLACDRNLDRHVALKFLTNATDADIARFRREARFTARLTDPGVAQIYELDASGARPFIAMQFIDGPSLASADLPHPEVVTKVRDVARTLAQAHASGIVHRDVKPENILLDRDGRPYLTDFGLARDLHAAPGEMSRELIAGTPGLMAPEQALGRVRDIDARTDVYALGATLFALLSGRPPFTGSNAVEILYAVIHDDVPFLRAIDPTIPRALEAIVVKCLQKRRSLRYATMTDMADALDAFLDGEPIADESSAWFRRLVGTRAPRRPEPSGDSDASMELAVARELMEWDANLYRVTQNLPRIYPHLDALIERLDAILEARPDTAWARFHRGAARLRRGRLQGALDDMELAIDRVTDRASAYFELGRAYLSLYLREHTQAFDHMSADGRDGHLERARAWLDRAVTAFRESQRLRGDLPLWQLDFARAIGLIARGDVAGAIAICDEVLARDPDVDDIWKLRGDACALIDEDPIPSYRRAVEIRRSNVDAWLALADAHLSRKDYARAREAIDQGLVMDPERVETHARAARVCLLETRAVADGGTSDVAAVERCVVSGLEHLGRTAADGGAAGYWVEVTRAELLLERARLDDDPAPIADALTSLAAARSLEGCPNRVELLTARAHLTRARILSTHGEEPHADLGAIDEIRRVSPDERLKTPGWSELFDELATLRGRHV